MGSVVERRAASQCHRIGLRETGYKLSQAILEWTEYSAGKPTTGAQPVSPDCPHVRRQYEFIPKFDELVDVDEIADVVGRAFSQNLLVDADPILTIDKVSRIPAAVRRPGRRLQRPARPPPKANRNNVPSIRPRITVQVSLEPRSIICSSSRTGRNLVLESWTSGLQGGVYPVTTPPRRWSTTSLAR